MPARMTALREWLASPDAKSSASGSPPASQSNSAAAAVPEGQLLGKVNEVAGKLGVSTIVPIHLRNFTLYIARLLKSACRCIDRLMNCVGCWTGQMSSLVLGSPLLLTQRLPRVLPRVGLFALIGAETLNRYHIRFPFDAEIDLFVACGTRSVYCKPH